MTSNFVEARFGAQQRVLAVHLPQVIIRLQHQEAAHEVVHDRPVIALQTEVLRQHLAEHNFHRGVANYGVYYDLR